MEIVESLREVFVTYGLSVVGGILILVAGWIVAGAVARWSRKALGRRERMDQTLVGILSSLLKYGILAVTVIAVLEQFGVETTSIIAVLGAAGLAIGLSLQGTLSHLAAGVMLLLFRPFKVGQFVEVGGTSGTVKELNLFSTELATPDNIQILVPNGRVWGDLVKNYSFHSTRRVDFTLGIAYESDIGTAMDTVRKVLTSDKRVHKDPEPQIVVGELAESSVNLIVRCWSKADDYWPLKFDLTRAFKDALDKAGISIPFPQREIRLIHESRAE